MWFTNRRIFVAKLAALVPAPRVHLVRHHGILGTAAKWKSQRIMCAATGGKINPLIGAAGISAFPMAARVVQIEGQRYNKKNYLLMHAMGANTGGQIGSVMAAAIMLSVVKGLGLA